MITAPLLREAIEAQCEVEDGSVAGYITVVGVLDLVELADVLNGLIGHPTRPLDTAALKEPSSGEC